MLAECHDEKQGGPAVGSGEDGGVADAARLRMAFEDFEPGGRDLRGAGHLARQRIVHDSRIVEARDADMAEMKDLMVLHRGYASLGFSSSFA